VQDFPVMNMLNGEAHLDEPVEDLVFAIAYFAYLLLIGYFRVQVSAIGIVHYDAETSFIHEGFFICYNIRMAHCLKHMYFIDSIFPLLLIHFRYINDFHDKRLPVNY